MAKALICQIMEQSRQSDKLDSLDNSKNLRGTSHQLTWKENKLNQHCIQVQAPNRPARQNRHHHVERQSGLPVKAKVPGNPEIVALIGNIWAYSGEPDK
jgi:hypothetical protein